MCLSFKILNLFGILSGSSNYRPSAPFLYEVASHVKNCHFGDYYYSAIIKLDFLTNERISRMHQSESPALVRRARLRGTRAQASAAEPTAVTDQPSPTSRHQCWRAANCQGKICKKTANILGDAKGEDAPANRLRNIYSTV